MAGLKTTRSLRIVPQPLPECFTGVWYLPLPRPPCPSATSRPASPPLPRPKPIGKETNFPRPRCYSLLQAASTLTSRLFFVSHTPTMASKHIILSTFFSRSLFMLCIQGRRGDQDRRDQVLSRGQVPVRRGAVVSDPSVPHQRQIPGVGCNINV